VAAAAFQTGVGKGGLRRLGLGGCVSLGDKFMESLALLAPNLERLDMHQVPTSVTRKGIQQFVRSATGLKELVVVVPEEENGMEVDFGDVVHGDDLASEEIFSPYATWEHISCELRNKI
jgi:hypothetical protein